MNGRAFCTSISHNNPRLHVKLTGIRSDIWAVAFSSLIRLEYAEQVEIYSKALTIVEHAEKGFAKQNLFFSCFCRTFLPQFPEIDRKQVIIIEGIKN